MVRSSSGRVSRRASHRGSVPAVLSFPGCRPGTASGAGVKRTSRYSRRFRTDQRHAPAERTGDILQPMDAFREWLIGERAAVAAPDQGADLREIAQQVVPADQDAMAVADLR